jgi:hypothetical protein
LEDFSGFKPVEVTCCVTAFRDYCPEYDRLPFRKKSAWQALPYCLDMMFSIEPVPKPPERIEKAAGL